MTNVDIDHLRSWIGKQQEKIDMISPRLVQSFNAIFDAPLDIPVGQDAPVGIHWCLAPDIAPMKALGPDGHPARGGFLPPVPFPRRMWAGGKLEYVDRLLVGDEVTRRSTIEDVVLKTGRSGALIFVTVHHDYETSRGLALRERQDIVYREAEAATASPVAPTKAEPAVQPDRTEVIDATPTLLFRYSALTFNGHRIHYDLDYVTREEGYPGLVFHGPLQASYLLRMAVDCLKGAMPGEFSFRSVRPLFSGGQVKINADSGSDLSLWFADQAGQKTMTATAALTRPLQ